MFQALSHYFHRVAVVHAAPACRDYSLCACPEQTFCLQDARPEQLREQWQTRRAALLGHGF
jgi:hypothetical protein